MFKRNCLLVLFPAWHFLLLSVPWWLFIYCKRSALRHLSPYLSDPLQCVPVRSQGHRPSNKVSRGWVLVTRPVERSSSTDVKQYWRKTMSILTSKKANTDVKHFRKNKQLLSLKDGQAFQTPNHVHAAASLFYLFHSDTELVSVVFTSPWDAFSASREQTKSLTADTFPEKNNALP